MQPSVQVGLAALAIVLVNGGSYSFALAQNQPATKPAPSQPAATQSASGQPLPAPASRPLPPPASQPLPANQPLPAPGVIKFSHEEVDQSRYVALAMPLASGRYKLLVLHQISNARPCWSENGSNPVMIDPLLVNFDFTGICGRSTDSNGYSIRVAGEDLVMRYSLTIETRNGELMLIGRGRDSSAPEMVIGRTYGQATGFQKFILEPGWRLTRRSFNGKTLGHVYFTNDSYSAAINPPSANLTPTPAIDQPLNSPVTPLGAPTPATPATSTMAIPARKTVTP